MIPPRAQSHPEHSMANGISSDLIFNCAKIVSFLSQGTTLLPGTVIITGTPAGVGFGMKPDPVYLHDGDEFVVELTPHVGSLYSVFESEK
jgi:2-keto-4-pentenoate hydratase/2-oxohepta-3-ene-1,7-dioic acid hydratase in catechol pathway